MAAPSSSSAVPQALLLVVALCVLLTAAQCQRAEGYIVPLAAERTAGTGLRYVHRVERGPQYDPRLVWSPLRVTVNCSTAAYTVLTASSVEQLESDAAATKVLWCGWRNILSEPNVCELRFSMLQDSLLAVRPAQAGLLSLGQPEFSCSVTSSNQPQHDQAVGITISSLAVALFVFAARLANSQAFRLTTGGLVGVTGAAAIVLILLMRNTPAKRAIGAGFAISASGMLGIVRWAFGTWMPGFRQLLFSRVALWYAIITGAAGVAVTYWLDDPGNQKINTSIRVALQLAALVALYNSFADDRLAVGAVALLMTYGWLWAILRHLYMAARWLHAAADWVRFKFGGGPARPRGADPDVQQLQFPLFYEEDSYHSSEDEDYVASDAEEGEGEEGEEVAGGGSWRRGSEDSGDGSGAQQAPRSTRTRAIAAQHPAAAPAAAAGAAAGRPPAQGWWQRLGGTWQQGAEGSGGVAEDEELDPAPSFDEWAQPRQQQQQQQGDAARAAAQASLAGAAAAGNAGAGRAPGPSPGSGWGSALMAVDLQQRSNQQQQQQQHQRQQWDAQRPASTSPWRDTGKVVDFTQPKPRSPPAAAAVGGAGSSRSTGLAAGAPAAVTPGGSRKVLNPLTGRDISTSGTVFRDLLAQGYTYDAAANMLLSPAANPSPAAAPGNVRGAPTPSSNLRSRRSSKV